uniref:Chromosome partitioning protein n=1 Tax=Candidatus Kentrum sp. LPFa TaxID=2126335 RepID=A0A450XGD7_9GAMM|nr:MAG: chromosome partitioning protein [Candidatus Kentron sp. LPFa]VFK28361.1 MAG: chromosome partitioning protein [Candidatus Kentron sp. LPFa]
MHIVSVINYKGGVGKTTITANLAAELARRGKSVLLIDLDPQASLTFSFIQPKQWKEEFAEARTIKRWFEATAEPANFDLASLIFQPPVNSRFPQNGGRIDLIPSHLGLINVDLELATELGGANMTQTKKKYIRVHRRLASGLDAIDPEKYELVLIDCPPNFNIVTKTAIVASSHILIPAKPDYLSTLGIDYLIRSLKELVDNFNEYAKLDSGHVEKPISPERLGVVFTMVQEYSGGPISAIRPFIARTKELDVPVFEAYIKENKTMFGDAPQFGVPVVLSPRSGATHEGVIRGIKRFVSEFEKRLGLE